MSMIFDDRDAAILARRMAAFDKRQGPRVGDYVYLPGEDAPRRFTYDWDDEIQTTSSFGSSFYLGEGGYVEYSGGLDPGIPKTGLVQLEETRPGSVWFFHHGLSGAHRGVHAQVPFRVFRFVGDLPIVYPRRCATTT